MRYLISRSNRFGVRLILGTLAILLYLPLVGCVDYHIEVVKAEPQEKQIHLDPVELRNCGSCEDLEEVVLSEADIEQRVTLDVEAVSQVSGATATISPEIREALENAVVEAYQPTYEEAKAAFQQVKRIVPPGKIHVISVRQSVQSFESTLSFRMNNETYITNYHYELCIPEVSGHIELACTG